MIKLKFLSKGYALAKYKGKKYTIIIPKEIDDIATDQEYTPSGGAIMAYCTVGSKGMIKRIDVSSLLATAN